MLQILRNKAQSIFIQVIVVIIALVFIFWGVGSSLMNNSDAALVVKNEEVSFQEYQTAYNQAYERMANQFGGKIPKGLEDSLGLKEQVINQLVQTALLRQGGKEMGIALSDLEIKNAIESISQFTKDGVFDPDTYNSVLTANRLSPTKFENNMRVDLLTEKTQKVISSFADSVTEFEINDFYAQINEGVSVQYVKISPELFSDKIKVDNEELATWFVKAADNYKSDAEIKVSYLDYSYKTIGEKIAIDAASIDQYYKENVDQFTNPAKRHARHILFVIDENDSEDVKKEKLEKAQLILARAKGEEDFATLAKEYSEGPSKTSGGDLGFFAQGDMVPVFDEAVFKLKVGEISEIVTSQFGYHIIKLEEAQDATVVSLTEAKEDIILALKRQQAEGLAFQMANDAYEGIIGAGSLAAYITKHPEAPFKVSDYFSKENAPAVIKSDSQLLDSAFKLKAKELSSLLKSNNGYAILFIDDKKTPQAPKLEDVKDVAIVDYKSELATNMAKEHAEKLLTSLSAADADMTALASEFGAKAEKTNFMKRQGSSSDFPSSLVEDIFALSPEKKLPTKVGEANGNFYVYSYLGRQDPEAITDSEEKERYKSGILMNKQQQLLSAWMLQQQANIEITRHPSL